MNLSAKMHGYQASTYRKSINLINVIMQSFDVHNNFFLLNWIHSRLANQKKNWRWNIVEDNLDVIKWITKIILIIMQSLFIDFKFCQANLLWYQSQINGFQHINQLFLYFSLLDANNLRSFQETTLNKFIMILKISIQSFVNF